jgi:large subunit ribosomal protein L22
MSISTEERAAREARKTNERPGVRAQHRNAGMSATKARAVLDLIRGKSVAEARTILQFCERGAAEEIAKVLDSAVANAANNNDIPPEELFVATAYADEGATAKRWRPRARGRATRIRKRTCHITVIVGRYSVSEFDAIRRRQEASGKRPADAATSRARRVARSKATEEATEEVVTDETATEAVATDDVATEDVASEESVEDAAVTEEAEAEVVAEASADEAPADEAGAEADTDSAETADDTAEAAADGAESDEKDD